MHFPNWFTSDTRAKMLSSPLGPTPTISQSIATALVRLTVATANKEIREDSRHYFVVMSTCLRSLSWEDLPPLLFLQIFKDSFIYVCLLNWIAYIIFKRLHVFYLKLHTKSSELFFVSDFCCVLDFR